MYVLHESTAAISGCMKVFCFSISDLIRSVVTGTLSVGAMQSYEVVLIAAKLNQYTGCRQSLTELVH